MLVPPLHKRIIDRSNIFLQCHRPNEHIKRGYGARRWFLVGIDDSELDSCEDGMCERANAGETVLLSGYP